MLTFHCDHSDHECYDERQTKYAKHLRTGCTGCNFPFSLPVKTEVRQKTLKGLSSDKSNMRSSQGIYLERKLSSLTFTNSIKDNILKVSKR